MADLERQEPDVQIPAPFDVFYRSEYQTVVALVYGLSGSRWAAEDIAQEAFLRAHHDWDDVRDMASPGAWVRRVALNLAVSSYRRVRAETSALLRIRRESEVQPTSAETEAFWVEVRRLPKRQGQAMALRYIEELSIAEIADVLGIAEGSVKALLHQGRSRLARQLTAKGWVEHEA